MTDKNDCTTGDRDDDAPTTGANDADSFTAGTGEEDVIGSETETETGIDTGSENQSDTTTKPNLRKALLLLLVGAGVIWLGYSDYTTQEERLENAVEVDAEIVETDVDRRSSSSGSSGSTYYPVVEFEYSYEESTYTSSNLHASDSRSGHSSRSAAQSIVAEYPEGEQVTAYLDPSEPETAFLETEESNSPFLWMGVGVLFVLAGGSMVVKGQVGTGGDNGEDDDKVEAWAEDKNGDRDQQTKWQ
ncbi:DUF3592 family protein [Natrialba magadii ATCC 43099]|uniref:DUF3592 family protein n=1 Tax=Natrialba magadii (strain ATCC 43099 / DSM 3394 / CCM 3739 / CIP 104546 / IAM 13178 / JCM 8861 / NBRC 102185 / NCIMB 2190 / MS3) TaxID=547559 RepID=D3SZI1_NATMM|nr:DUF3592 domain-containing protein [Natrialba magadii]ADD04315.1 DUF3592 family protein [Natrialba magadii ATCC 43099]ELY26717.1 hypothetical protein C500_16190 [Natrialba magadii ATCC 43099]